MELSVTCGVLESLDSRLLGRGGRWAINKGLRGPKKFAEGLRLQLHGEQMEESDADSHWALGPPLSQQSCNSLVRRVGWSSRFWASEIPSPPSQEGAP